jgi:uncharacterized coiled-coil protein SlyX
MSNILTKLEYACIASCTCLTKTPDFQRHFSDCRYRVLNEAIECIAEQRTTIANLSKVVANDLVAMEELRLQIRDAQEDAGNYRTSAEAEIGQLRGQLSTVRSLLAEFYRRIRDTPASNSLVARIERALAESEPAQKPVVKCTECGATNTAPITPGGKLWQCSCGQVFQP